MYYNVHIEYLFHRFKPFWKTFALEEAKSFELECISPPSPSTRTPLYIFEVARVAKTYTSALSERTKFPDLDGSAIASADFRHLEYRNGAVWRRLES